MTDRAEWMDLFLSASGRITRGPFLIASAVLLGFAVLYDAVVGDVLGGLTGWFVYPGLIFGGACLLSKRLHDRGKSGWWAALILLSLVAVWPTPQHVLDFLFATVLAWAAIELYAMPGEQGANRHGVNPARPGVAV